MTENLGRADTVRINSDENGFELHLSTDQGIYVANIHGCTMSLIQQVDEHLRPYWDEAHRLAAEHQAFRCDPDESGGYDRSDPKHENWHSVHADIWDNRDGK